MMFRARERGMSFWPFAISLLLLIALVIMWFSATSERDQEKARADRADAAAKKAEGDRDAKAKEFIAVSGLVGFLEGANTSSPAAIEAQIKQSKDKLKTTLTAVFPATSYQPGDEGGKIVKQDAGQVTVAYLTEAELNDITTMQGFLSKFEVASSRLKSDMEKSYAATDQARKDKETAAAASESALKSKDTRISELTAEKAAGENAAREKETELKETISQKETALAAAQQEAEGVRKQATDTETKLVAKNKELETTVMGLVQREAPQLTEGPDGEVVVADRGVAIINRGRINWLMPGTTFEVLGRAKGGATYRKGSIKVTSCDDETARAAITDEKPSDPITRGDLIQSPVYSPNRQLHFVLIGDFKKMGRSTAEAVLKRLGAVVDSKVSAETNYLVIGTTPAGQESIEDSDAVKTAKDLSIRMITEEQLASFSKY